MTRGIIDRLEQEMPAFVKSQRKVADYIIKEPVQSAFYTIDKLAHASGVSTATVVRLAQSMGYSNYSLFQKELQRYVQSKSTPLEKMALVDIEETLSAKRGTSHLEDVTAVLMENFQKTINGLSEETISKIADMIISAHHVYITGQRGTKHLAVYLAYHLDRMFAKVDFLPSESTRLPEIIQRIDGQDVLIISTVYRYSALATRLAKMVKEKGAAIVAISDSYDSPLSPYSDYQLITYCKTRDFHNSGAAMIYLADILIDSCYRKAKADVLQTLNHAELYVKELKMKTP